jgi:hypothetical protein
MSFKKAQSKDDAPVTFSNHPHIACKYTKSTKHKAQSTKHKAQSIKNFSNMNALLFIWLTNFFVEQINYKI